MSTGPTHSTEIEDTFAEAFSMRYARLIVTAIDAYWLDAAVREFCGFGSSVIQCDAEVGVERHLEPTDTFDGRVGAALLVFGFDDSKLTKSIQKRTGQCLMTCPTTAVFDGLPGSESNAPLGDHLRFFGDGFQKSKVIGDRRYWRIPVMDGEFLVESEVGIRAGIGGGNFLVQSRDQPSGLAAVRRSTAVIANCPGVITPFPGGVVRSGSKVGSRYDGLVASTSDRHCPSLRGRVDSDIHPQANCVYEIVIDGESFEQVAKAMAHGIQAALSSDILLISAGNYGGKLGKHHFYLKQIMSDFLE
ncbi:MAG: formylmethanofuran--tetrahydromethanopterin N-formyltransferase [Mariniblastus sp.]|nr:formylmethanofuran--tetrahydromethanopterin N-formyltransferase [Mariniblastus sp.]